MNLRVAFAVTVTVLLLLVVGCSQEQITNPGLQPNADSGSTEVRPPEENLGALTKASDETVSGRYIVQFNGDVANVRDRALQLAAKYGFSLGSVYQYAIKGFPVQIAPEVADNLRHEFDVLTVVPDQRAHAVAQVLPTGVNRIDTELNTFAAIDGVPNALDIDIAILDTGIDPSHPELNVVDGVKFSYGVSSPYYMDDHGHGTHVAGIAAAIDNTQGVVGVAPGARLWAVKVLDSTGSGLFSDIILGLDWVTARAAQIDVVNMSLAGVGWNTPLFDAVNACVNAGVVVVVAAGNEAMDIFGADGIIGTGDDIVPAAIPSAATISALVDTDGMPGGVGPASTYGPDDSFASFSNFSGSVHPGNPVTSPGKAIDLVLPGVNITSTIPGGGYYAASGTSMASPHAAGLFALAMLEFGNPTNASGVYALRQALIDRGVNQDSGLGLNTLNDPDGNRERLGWAVVPTLFTDIAVYRFTGPDSVLPGEKLYMDVTLANLGNENSPSFDAFIYVQGLGKELIRRTLTSLGASDAISRTVHFEVPAKDLYAATGAPGIYTLVCTHNFTDGVPANDQLTIDVELLATGDFGTVVINPDPDALNAPWTITGPDTMIQTGNGDAAFPGLPLGDYSITWGSVPGWIAPGPETLTLTKDATITFNGLYTQIPTTGTVVLNPDPDSLNAPWSLVGPDKAIYNGNGDSTLNNVPTGDYTVTWGSVAGYLPPASETLTLATDATITFNGLYTEILTTGTVVVNPDPDFLDAPWMAVGPDKALYHANGDSTLVDVPAGDYTVTWGAVAGYTTPAPETLTLGGGATITFNGLYQEVAAIGTVVINPEPNALNAPWSVTGPQGTSNGRGDVTVPGLPVGDYSITWGAVAGWIAPAPQTLTLTANATITFLGVYTQITTGTVVINPDPDALNAPWSVTGPDKAVYTGNGDDSLVGVPAGSYTMTWGAVAGYTTPAGGTLTLAAGGTITFAGTYTVALGSITVNPDPNALNAPWTLTGPNAYSLNGNGDQTVPGLAAGDYTVTWGAVAGYNTPVPATQTLAPGGSLTFNGVYTLIPVGTVVIDPNPDAINAPWELDGPGGLQSGNGDATLLNQLTGLYTLTWGAVGGYDTPAPETLTLTNGATITFAATYEVIGPGETLGIWFDTGATQVCKEVTPSSMVNMYIVYSNPSLAGTRGFECGFNLSRPGGSTFTSIMFPATFPIQAIDVGTNTPLDGTFNYIVGFSGVLPTSQNTLMATLTMFLLDPLPLDVNVRPAIPSTIPGTPSVLKEDYNPLAVPIGAPVLSLVPTGGCGKVQTADQSWDGVKKLFR